MNQLSQQYVPTGEKTPLVQDNNEATRTPERDSE